MLQGQYIYVSIDMWDFLQTQYVNQNCYEYQVNTNKYFVKWHVYFIIVLILADVLLNMIHNGH